MAFSHLRMNISPFPSNSLPNSMSSWYRKQQTPVHVLHRLHWKSLLTHFNYKAHMSEYLGYLNMSYQAWKVYEARVLLDDLINCRWLGADPMSAMDEGLLHCRLNRAYVLQCWFHPFDDRQPFSWVFIWGLSCCCWWWWCYCSNGPRQLPLLITALALL